MRTLALLAVCGLVCGLAGYVLGTRAAPVSNRSPGQGGRAPGPSGAERGGTDAGMRASEPPRTEATPGAGSAPASLDDLVAASFRGEPLPQRVLDRAQELYDQDLATAAARSAAQAAGEERDRRDVLQMEAAGEMPRLLDSLAGKNTTLPDLAADGGRMLSLLRGPAKGPAVDEPDLARLESGDLADGTTILLPVGKIARPWRRSGKPFPSSVTLSGAGIDRTLLDVEIDPDRPVLALTFENMTVTSQDFVDAEKALTLILRNVRAAGYNSGAGGSSLMDIRSANFALYAEDCVFDGSVGRGGSRHGTPFSLSCKAKILRFTRCTFVENDEPVRLWGTATIHFEACRFVGNGKARVAGAVYRDCVFEGNGDDR